MTCIKCLMCNNLIFGKCTGNYEPCEKLDSEVWKNDSFIS